MAYILMYILIHAYHSQVGILYDITQISKNGMIKKIVPLILI